MWQWSKFVEDRLANLKSSSLERPQVVHENISGSSTQIVLSGKRLTLFSSNDYLGLSCHPEICEQASRVAQLYGCGIRSSALISGYSQFHRQLEVALAELKSTEDCLLYPTGFAANLGILSSVAGNEQTAIFSDELNHASVVDGARLAAKSGAKLYIYRHNDIQHLSQLLTQCPTSYKRRLVVSDSLFSMDGDWVDLQGIVELKKQHEFLLALDEAHATLVVGESGGGLADQLGLEHEVDLQIGTLSKAFGCQGGFVCCNKQMKQFLWNKSRTQVFSTALPIPVVAAAATALKISQREQWRRKHLFKLIDVVNRQWGTNFSSPILPYIIGPEQKTLLICKQLEHVGFKVPAIRPPTVPLNTSRLRVSLSADHSMREVQELAKSVLEATSQQIRSSKL
eukprot:TRINITY_DN4461_c0_g1_i1.p1 TRINITY_DN4461_c0_g1~~TRINITY_DN4461_c0_g1_i1.p1  ORF type:complete len:397 (+),score=23.96 TRINITY_DN4461_c0_g1_i1:22-1212(+)